MENTKYIILFNSPHHELQAEKVFKENQLRPKVVPVPEKYSAGCDIALEISHSSKKKVERMFEEARVQFKGIYPLEL